ncbi:MAG: hypothetical protein EAY75_02175, partial [Bacteroidetes bacterium]
MGVPTFFITIAHQQKTIYMSSHQPYSFFQSVEQSFDKAAKYTTWNPGILEQIKACNAVYQMR